MISEVRGLTWTGNSAIDNVNIIIDTLENSPQSSSHPGRTKALVTETFKCELKEKNEEENCIIVTHECCVLCVESMGGLKLLFWLSTQLNKCFIMFQQ